MIKTTTNVSGSSLKGYIRIPYKILKKRLGRPGKFNGYKTDAEWNLQFPDGTIATIYNWKNGKNYNGRKGLRKGKITEWHIGGFDNKAFEHVAGLFPEYESTMDFMEFIGAKF
jgi:hypothetical protein